MSKTYVAVQRTGQKGEIQHKNYKYLYKKKVNGKWRYYYDVGKSNWTIDGKPESRIQSYTKLEDVMGKDEKDRLRIAKSNAEENRDVEKHYKKQFEDIEEKVLSREYFDKDNGDYSILKPYYDDYDNARTKREQTDKQLIKAENDYSKTPLYKIEKAKETINDGKNWLKKKLAIH